MKEWERLSTDQMKAMTAVQAHVLKHLRGVLDDEAFIEFLPPVTGPVTDPGTRGAKQAAIDYYGHRYKLMSSAILYKQLATFAQDRIYMNAPCMRLEPLETATTGRHLTEFYQLDLEVKHASLEEILGVAETLLRGVHDRIWNTAKPELEALGAKQWDMSQPFPRYTHAEAVAKLAELGHPVDAGSEIPWAAEKLLSLHHETPFFITHYPRGSRGFYDKISPDDPNLLLDFDLLYPGGFGEAVSGAERETDPLIVVERMRESGEEIGKYGWYFEMIRAGVDSTAGFGIGVERLTRFLTQADSVIDARPYPKVAGKIGP